MNTEWSQLGPAGAFYECVRWHDGSWWASDIHGHQVIRVEVDGSTEVVLELDDRPAGLGWLPDDSLLVVSMLRKEVLRVSDGVVEVYADVSAWCAGPVNEMVVTADGSAYVGSFGFDLDAGADFAPADLIRIAADRHPQVVASDLAFPNGSMITPDGRTLLVNETFASRHTAFTIADDGTLGHRRVWAQVAPAPPPGALDAMTAVNRYAPDGGDLDRAGRIWAADALHGRCLRVAEGGEVLDELRLPAGLDPFACAIGGFDGDTLLVAAAPDYDPVKRSRRRESVLLTRRIESA